MYSKGRKGLSRYERDKNIYISLETLTTTHPKKG